MYFMSTVCGRPQGGWGVRPCGRMWTGGGGQKRDIFVDVINGWPLRTCICYVVYGLALIVLS